MISLAPGLRLPDSAVTNSYALLGMAWAAGFFEGEGCISNDVGNRGRDRRLSIVNTDTEMLYRFQSIVECGSVRRRVAGNERWKPQWLWSVTRWAEIERVLGAFMPFLSERRRTKALELLSTPPSRGLGFCARGHPLVGPEADVYLRKSGARICAVCARDRARLVRR